MTEDERAMYIRKVRFFLVHSFIYYEMNESLITDNKYDEVAKFIFENKHQIKKIDDQLYSLIAELDESGSGFYIKKYSPDIITVAMHRLYQASNKKLNFWEFVEKKGYTIMGVKTQKPEFRLIIAGGRDFSDEKLLIEKCDKILSEKAKTHSITIITGGASGADKLGHRYALKRGYDTVESNADWDRYEKSAGMIRNKEMVNMGDALIAFWDGKSNGTANMIKIAKDKGLPVRIIKYNN